MNNKKFAYLLFFTSLLFTLFIVFFNKSISYNLDNFFALSGICGSYGGWSCYNWSELTLISGLVLLSNLLFLSVFLLFVRYEVLVRWYKFARIALPIMILLMSYLIVIFVPRVGSFSLLPSFEDFHILILPFVFKSLSSTNLSLFD